MGHIFGIEYKMNFFFKKIVKSANPPGGFSIVKVRSLLKNQLNKSILSTPSEE
jgi:hypothetical protein